MSKLTKAQAKAHRAACDLLTKEKLTLDDRWFVIEHWQESATHINSVAGAFFTPPGLASDFAIDVAGSRIIDLCAGIGALSFACWSRSQYGERIPEIVCVEKNPDYVAVGRKVLPEATWIEADIFDLPDFGRFDCAISNPPFGSTSRSGSKAPRFTGQEFEYHVIDIASDIADYGTFIIPQVSAPFTYSGRQSFSERKSDRYLEFSKQTGIDLTPGCGVDTAFYQGGWHGVSPMVEIVLADFVAAHKRRQFDGLPLFQEAAE